MTTTTKHNDGNLKGVCHSCGKACYELQNICVMNCSSPDNPKGLDIVFHENCGVSISSGEFELPS